MTDIPNTLLGTMAHVSKLLVEVNSLCNNNCVYCYLSDKKSDGLDSFSHLSSRLEYFRKSGTRYLDISGGEPTLWSHLTRLMRHARDIGFENITLVTNGRRLAYSKYLEKLITSGLERVVISFDGPDKETAESITRTPGSFKETIMAMKNIKKAGIELGVTIVVVKQNYKKLPEMFDMVFSLKADFLNVQFMLPDFEYGRSIPSDIVPRYDDVLPYIKKAVDNHSKQKINIHFVPFCCLPGLDDRISPESIKDHRHVVNFSGLEYNLGEHLRNGCIKPASCKSCKHNERCIGFFTSYAKELGISIPETSPI